MKPTKKRGRPAGKKAEDTVTYSFRLTVPEGEALERYAKENDRKVAAESARAVRKYLRDNGQLEK